MILMVHLWIWPIFQIILILRIISTLGCFYAVFWPNFDSLKFFFTISPHLLYLAEKLSAFPHLTTLFVFIALLFLFFTFQFFAMISHNRLSQFAITALWYFQKQFIHFSLLSLYSFLVFNTRSNLFNFLIKEFKKLIQNLQIEICP